MNEDREKAHMEAFYISRMGAHSHVGWGRDKRGMYHSEFARVAWDAWQEAKKTRNEERAVVETVNSTSDERTVNNVMRHEYRVLNDDEKVIMKSFKDMGLDFVKACDAIGTSRELAIAKTKIEEAVMWAVKHITR